MLIMMKKFTVEVTKDGEKLLQNELTDNFVSILSRCEVTLADTINTVRFTCYATEQHFMELIDALERNSVIVASIIY